MQDEFEDVKAFHRKFDLIHFEDTKPRHLTKRKLMERIECMREELLEFNQAAQKQDLVAQADALVDLVYFAIGTAVQLNLPWDELWADVQRANISKERGVGKRGHAVDVIKPPGWQGPRGDSILAFHGYDRRVWEDQTGEVAEGKCHDDQPPI